MNGATLALLVCPACAAGDLRMSVFAAQGDDVIEGVIRCAACGAWNRVENGIADLMPVSLRNPAAYRRFAARHSLPLAADEGPVAEAGKQIQKEFYEDEENAEDYENRVVNNSYYRALNEVTFIPWMKQHLGSGDLALEVGCGTGKQCVFLAQHGVQTIGLDISERMLALARQKLVKRGLADRVALIVADGENPPMKAGCFNACIFYGTLHHMQHKDVAIRNAARTLRPGGHFYSLDPHRSPVRFLFDLLMRLWKIYDEKADADALLTEHNLRRWLDGGGLAGATRLSTYFPPHLWRFCGEKCGVRFLRATDAIMSRLPAVRVCAGVVIADATKESAV